MTDQTPTDDAVRRAHEWCDLHWPTDENRTPMADVIRHYRATVPAPPATLADELREWLKAQHTCAILEWQWDNLVALADRVEAAEKERAEARHELEQIRKDADRMVETYAAQAERLAGQLHTAESNHAYSAERWNKAEEDLAEADAEVERLTVSLNRQCTTVTPSVHNTDALPDPADVPEGEAWTIKIPDGEARAFKTTAGWVYEQNGGYVEVRGDAANVILVARLVPDTSRMIDHDDHMNHLIEPASIPQGQPWLVRDDQGLGVGVRCDPSDEHPWDILRLQNRGLRWRTDADMTLVRPIDIDGLGIEVTA